ncbi:MAG: hypothetical protein IJI68_04265 [Eggerthellaceae bacterium]|nr:hypothetical protein [Eggerthellaceae bacterium]
MMLNITPDHIHWHKTFEAYRDAKFKMLDNMSQAKLAHKGAAPGGTGAPERRPGASEAATRGGRSGSEDCLSERSERVPQLLRPTEERESQRTLGTAPARPFPRGLQTSEKAKLAESVAILDATNDVVRAKVRELKGLSLEERGFDYIPMGTADGFGGDMRARCGADNAAFIDEDRIMRVAYAGEEHALLCTDELQIKGAHNASNALAAAAVAVVLGADDAKISEALKSFPPLEHRIEPCGVIDGVECFNDSKATNVDATLKALEAFPGRRIVVLLGGDDKGTELEELVKSTYAHAEAAVCFGTAGERFEKAFQQAADLAPAGFELVHRCHLSDALDAALDLAGQGDVVLLSPACASFDEFSSFEHRGRVFKQLVAQRAAAAAGGE